MLSRRQINKVQSKVLTVVPETESSDSHLAETEPWSKHGKVSDRNRAEEVEEEDREAGLLQT